MIDGYSDILQNLKDNPGLLEKIFAEMPLPLVLFNRDGEILLASSAFIALTGIRNEGGPSKKHIIWDYLDGENAVMEEAICDAFDGGVKDISYIENPLRTKQWAENGKEEKKHYRGVFFAAAYNRVGVDCAAALFIETKPEKYGGDDYG